MTASNTAGASSALMLWSAIDWQKVEKNVYRLQVRIAKAVQAKKYGKVKALQWILVHSVSAKLLSIRKVATNKGKRTAGIDGITWATDNQKALAVNQLKRHGYKSRPLRRIYIPKSNGKTRPLGIPTMKDRAMQALYLLTLEPISETTADKNSYGFRPKRSCHDAIEQCFTLLARKASVKWILECDIKGCFDNINHSWIMDNIPIDKTILHQFIKSGFIENGSKYPTHSGTTQGGVISACIANMTLDKLETTIKNSVAKSNLIHVCRYADDFIVTGRNPEILKNEVKSAIINFLGDRGLELSSEKTKITHINEGFDFLGFNIRKYRDKLLIKPSKQSVKDFLTTIRKFLNKNITAKQECILLNINPKIIGWARYYRHAVSKDVFNYVDDQIYRSLQKWINKRHPNKSEHWKSKKYFRAEGGRNWVFSTTYANEKGIKCTEKRCLALDILIKRHIKIRADANPYDPKYREYFENRELLGRSKYGLKMA